MAEIGIGMLGYAFMGKAHSNAFRTIAYMTWPPPLEPRLVGIAGRNPEAVDEAARRYGFEYATNDWRRLVADEDPLDAVRSATPAGRIGTSEETADTILFLCSDAARFIHGQVLEVNGGFLMA